MEKALEKLKSLKRNMDYNLSIPSIQILPIINEVILELEKLEQNPTEIKKDTPNKEPIAPVVIVPQTTVSDEPIPELNQVTNNVPVEVKPIEIYKDIEVIKDSTKTNVAEPIKFKIDTATRAMEYLRSIKARGLNYKSDDNLIARAVKEGFIA